MYQRYYNLTRPPFENTPDPRFFYASEDHREALAAVEYTIRMRKGLVLITGEIGAGKTTVSHMLRQRIGAQSEVHIVRQGHTTPKQLLRQLCREMRLVLSANCDRSEMLDALEQTLLAHHSAGQSVVLIVDEAQMLPVAVLDELRLLTNIETPTDKLIQVVLIGQPELRRILQSAEMAAMRQRIVLTHHLHAMGADDTGAYIHHRLRIAGDGTEPMVRFAPEAVAAIHEFTGGIPRLINSTADSCLLVGYVRSTRVIDAEIVRTVVATLLPHNGLVIMDRPSRGSEGRTQGEATISSASPVIVPAERAVDWHELSDTTSQAAAA